MSSEAWASEPSQLPWRTEPPFGVHVMDAYGRLIATCEHPRDAQHIVGKANSTEASDRPMSVRYISAGLWLGQCFFSTPSHLLTGPDAVSTLQLLAQHYREVHIPPTVHVPRHALPTKRPTSPKETS